MKDAARILAEAASTTRFDTLPLEVRSAYRDYILDTIGVMAAGAAHPAMTELRAAFAASGGSGMASVAGHADGVPAGVAGYLNGSAMTVLQLQDGHRRARGHPMSHVLPAALALAEETGASGARLADAIVAGYEVCARVGASLGGMQPLLHDAGTFGCIGAAVAAAYLLSWDQGEDRRIALIEAAIGNAAAVALFPFRETCMEGATGHHMFVGLGVQNGIAAARSSLAGLKPSALTLERFFGPRAGDAFDSALLTSGVGIDGQWSDYEIEQAYLKWHPVCAHLGPMLDCLELLQDRLGTFDVADISEIVIEVYATALQYDSPQPRNDLAARFSFRHAAALALLFPPLRHDSFADAILKNAEVDRLVAKIKLRADPAFDALYPANRPARVTLRFASHHEESAQVLVPRGDGVRRLTRIEVDAKACRLIDAAWGEGAFADVRRAVDTLEHEVPQDLAQRLGHLLRRPFAA